MHNSSTAVLNLIENHRIYPFYGQKCTQMCTLVCTIGTHTGNKPVVAILDTAYEHVRLAIVSLFKIKLINYLSVDLVRFNFDDSSESPASR